MPDINEASSETAANEKGKEVQPETGRKPNDLTAMFYFASDNPLAPGIVSQLKALKDAGYHKKVNVIAQYDPHMPKTPTCVYDVNSINKLMSKSEEFIGFNPHDPYVRNLTLDKLWGPALDEREMVGKINDYLNSHQRLDGWWNYALPAAHTSSRVVEAHLAQPGSRIAEVDGDSVTPGETESVVFNPPALFPEMCAEQSPYNSLQNFLEFCRTNYPARHYILFILGHGLVVGNDLFLFDMHVPEDDEDAAPLNQGENNADPKEKPKHLADHLTLKNLGCILREFCGNIKGQGELEGLMLHSCSMSSIELAYQLKGTAKFMLASQSPAFVGSWPYRQIVIRLLNDVHRSYPHQDEEGKIIPGVPLNFETMFSNIYYYVLNNSLDFELSGYSFDLCLTDLTKLDKKTDPANTSKKSDLTEAVNLLGQQLTAGLSDPILSQLILLAHWDAQSYWQESYTDLYDFCYCLTKRIISSGLANDVLRPQIQQSGVVDPKELPALIDTGELIIAQSTMLGRMMSACTAVRGLIHCGAKGGPIIRSGFAGSTSQYSHGWSIYFPWALPVNEKFIRQYDQYDFSAETGWNAFLKKYFELTMRKTRSEEHDDFDKVHVMGGAIEKEVLDLMRDLAGRQFNAGGGLSKGGSGDPTGGPDGSKGGSGDPSGSDCDCPAIKNYPVFRLKGHDSGLGDTEYPLDVDFGSKRRATGF